MKQHMEMNKNEILQAIRTTAKRIMPSGARVILFGSQTCGDSDWDILNVFFVNNL
ncbi:hypothetical protein HMPREF1077_01410 [Parabacteroides johnsonii CL02T12C29]|uniref:Polymerase nucleotidyl transferase domain-containing protein n=1 Tax=Parabacteroides johnsonii CL02T12C29 TaxID=999419 RepID=K5YCJ8_9BACT|nr:hypothetical protein HMPREF1077_01410 [Parabacteroides johnsonii CL02T12C29]